MKESNRFTLDVIIIVFASMFALGSLVGLGITLFNSHGLASGGGTMPIGRRLMDASIWVAFLAAAVFVIVSCAKNIARHNRRQR